MMAKWKWNMENDITRQKIVSLSWTKLGGRVEQSSMWNYRKPTLRRMQQQRMKWPGNWIETMESIDLYSRPRRVDAWKESDAMAGFQVLVKFIIRSVYFRCFVQCAASMPKKKKGSNSVLHKFKLLACIVTISVLFDKWSVSIIFCARFSVH